MEDAEQRNIKTRVYWGLKQISDCLKNKFWVFQYPPKETIQAFYTNRYDLSLSDILQ